MTAGFDVFVQHVIAAITTLPCSSSKSSPSTCTLVRLRRRRPRPARRRARARRAPPGACSAVGSLAGKVSATALSGLPFVSVVDAERPERLEERRLRVARAARGPAAGAGRELGSTVERSSSTICEYSARPRVVQEHVLLAVRLDERDPLVAVAR